MSSTFPSECLEFGDSTDDRREMISNNEDNCVDEATTHTSTNLCAPPIPDSPVTTSCRNLGTNEPEQPLSSRTLTEMSNSSCQIRRSNYLTMCFEPVIDSSCFPEPSSSSNLLGSSTSSSELRSVDSTNDTDQVTVQSSHSLNTLVEPTNEVIEPINTMRRNSMNDTNRAILNDESLDMESDNNCVLPLPNYGASSRDYYKAAEEILATSNRLLDSEESDSFSFPRSTCTMQSRVPCLRFPVNFQTDLQNSVDDHHSRRRTSQFGRFDLPSLLTDCRDNESETSVHLGSTRRLTNLQSKLQTSRCYMRHFHANQSSRHKKAAVRSNVSFNEDGRNSAKINILHEMSSRPYHRNPWLRVRSHVNPSENDSKLNRPSNFPSVAAQALSRYIQMRSVSPEMIPVSASVYEEPLNYINHRYLTHNSENEIPRPDTPIPPVPSPTHTPIPPVPSPSYTPILPIPSPTPTPSLSDGDDDTPLLIVPNSSTTHHQVTTSLEIPQSKPTSMPINLSMNLINQHEVMKETLHTDEDLNNELVQLLECPICFEFSTPPINQCIRGHIICKHCRKRVKTCPTCRTTFQENRNLLIEKVAELLRYPCKNAATGCTDFLRLFQKDQHEISCSFRHYICFVPSCSWRGYKSDLLAHIQKTHRDRVVNGPKTNLLIPVSGQMRKVWLMTAFDELFYVVFFTSSHILRGYIQFIGDRSKCDKYIYSISVTSAEDMLRNFNFTRRTHPYEEHPGNKDMMDSYDLFSISHAQLNLFRKGTEVPVQVTIEEA